MKIHACLMGCLIGLICHGQTVKEKLILAIAQLEADPQLRHAVIGFSVYDSKTGQPFFEHNAQAGLAAASTQKLFTSCAAFDLLGKDYQYTTEIGYNAGTATEKAGFIIKPSCDPSFGSFRFAATKPAQLLNDIVMALQARKIKTVSSSFKIMDTLYDNNLPGGWIWEDIGNYYGAGAQGFNWMENQFDIILKSGKRLGDEVSLVETRPASLLSGADVHVKTAAKGSGDNTVVFLDYGTRPAFIEGTIPVDEEAFAVGAAIANPANVFMKQLMEKLRSAGIAVTDSGGYRPSTSAFPDTSLSYRKLYTFVSPPLDSLNYWFLKKSINLYGEALLKTMAYRQSGYGSTQKGVELLKDFWTGRGIERSAIHLCDGSGLSPQNRVTADALVKVLQYAKTRPWYGSFYYALPEYNGMKMKSGSIGGARAYAGYQLGKDGREYSFAIIINNYDGPAADVVKKMYRLLDNLK